MVGAPVAGVLGGGGAAATAPVAVLVSCLVVAPVVGEGHPHRDGLALVVVGQGVAAGDCPVDLSVVGKPLVGECCVGHAVGVGNAGGVRRQGLPDLGGAADRGRSRGRGVRPRNGQLKPAGQFPAFPGADGSLGGAVGGASERQVDVPVAVGRDVNLPPDIAGRDQPAHIGHRSPGHGERMIPHRRVAEVRLGVLAEPQLEGERVLPVVG